MSEYHTGVEMQGESAADIVLAAENSLFENEIFGSADSAQEKRLPENAPASFEKAPDRAEDYDLYGTLVKDGGGENIDPAFLGAMAGEMHKLGLTTSQARDLARAYQKQLSALMGESSRKYKVEVEALRREWGRNYSYLSACAQRGARLMGLNSNEIKAIETAFGARSMLEKFAKIGEAVNEDSPVLSGRGEGGDFRLAPQAAKEKMNELLRDPEFGRRYLAGDGEALRKIELLSRKASRL